MYGLRRSFASVALALLVGISSPATSAAGELGKADSGLPQSVGFDRHVLPLLGRLGCNAGTCHGAAKGKGGFHLSLFGADPAGDYDALVEEGRVDPTSPEEGLLLRKPTGRVRHGGGLRLRPDSREYRVLLRWIEQGAKRGPTASVRRLTLTPAELRFAGSGSAGGLRVTAEFADGSRQDVTPFCTFRSTDEAVAEVNGEGQVRGRQPGAGFVVAGYGGAWASVAVLVPRSTKADFVYPDTPANNFIDRLVLGRLRRLNLVPSPVCTDAEFLRRVTIDVTGSLPTPDEVRAFLADKGAGKRAKKIDELLASPRHAALWATKFCDWTACDVAALEEPNELRLARARMWHDWFRKRIQDNVSYDRIVRGVLYGTSRGGRDLSGWMDDEAARIRSARVHGSDPGYASDPGYSSRPFLDLYWRRMAAGAPFPPERLAEVTATAFLGLRLQCAQCHRHPTDRWTQADYRAFTNAFARVRFGQSPELRLAVAERLEAQRAGRRHSPPLPRLQEVYLEDGKERYLPDPVTGQPLPPRAPGGPLLDDTRDAREALIAWMTQPNNSYFARNFANRVWQHYFGRGLIEPADDFSDAHPASHPELLNALAAEFVRSGYDIRRLEQLVLRSRTYQLSSSPNATNADDFSGFARFRPRRPMAEVVADLLHDALGVAPDYHPDAPVGARAVEVATNQPRNRLLDRLARTFGRPARQQLCDCERRADPVVAESLLMMSDPTLLELAGRGHAARLRARGAADAEAVEELFLAALSRPPRPDERAAALEYLRARAGRRKGLEGILWALINTREFILVH